MSVGALILVETGLPGNLGAAMRVAANFGIPRLELVRPAISPDDPEVLSWACGAEDQLQCRRWPSFAEACAPYRTLAASASGRGRKNLPVLSPPEAIPLLLERGPEQAALVFGNETRGLTRDHLDRCDMVIRIPTDPAFPVLNLVQAIAILVAEAHLWAVGAPDAAPEPASQVEVEALMAHLDQSLSVIGFLDPQSPQRILRKLRRLFGRAGITDNEVQIVRGICRQMEWAAGAKPGRYSKVDADEDE